MAQLTHLFWMKCSIKNWKLFTSVLAIHFISIQRKIVGGEEIRLPLQELIPMTSEARCVVFFFPTCITQRMELKFLVWQWWKPEIGITSLNWTCQMSDLFCTMLHKYFDSCWLYATLLRYRNQWKYKNGINISAKI